MKVITRTYPKVKLPELKFYSTSGEIRYLRKKITIKDISITVSEEFKILIDCKFEDIDLKEYFGTKIILCSKKKWNIEITRITDFDINHSEKKARFIANQLNASKGKIKKDDMLNVFILLTNLEFEGNEIEEIDGSYEKNIITLSNSRFKDHLLIRKKQFPLKYIDGYFTFSDKFKSLTRWSKKYEKLMFLLSFCCGNIIHFPIRYSHKGKQYQRLEISSPRMLTHRGSSLILLDRPGDLSLFLNSTISNFFKFQSKLNLLTLFDYYVQMKNTPFIESRFVIGCVILEGLKYHYAKNIKEYEQDTNGFFLKNPRINRAKYSFKEIISQICSDYSIIEIDQLFYDYRNEIIHQGCFNQDFEKMIMEANRLENFINIIFLTIFNYEGVYWDLIDDKWTKIHKTA